MKILYIKSNSERAKKYQLKTIIYEIDNQRYVKKQALCEEAIPHLMKMKENYKKITASIINPKVKLSKILEETEDSLVFEYITGISLETKFHNAIKAGSNQINIIVSEYMELLSSGFKTTKFLQSNIEHNQLISYFGDNDYSNLDEKIAFDGVSNIDLIFSNIILQNDSIYLIDYEWVFNLSLPINFVAFRQFENLEFPDKLRREIYNNLNISIDKNLFSKMNTQLILNNITNKETFYQYADNYKKSNLNYLDLIEAQTKRITALSSNSGSDLAYAHAIIALKDAQLESMRLKNRLKKFIKTFIPAKVLIFFGYTPLNQTSHERINKSISYTYHTPVLDNKRSEKISHFTRTPLISIIMPVYNVDPKWLELAIKSIENQWYENWELCIADDKSTNEDIITYLKNINHPKIKITFLEINLNISGASNAALRLASGEYIALMDNDDEITPDALYEMVKAINEENAEFIYSDEDFMTTEGVCTNPHFKPDFSPDLLLSHNYITHFSCFKTSLLDEVGNFNSEFDGSQDYDLFLRLTEKTSKIYHIQKVLYHWRMLETSTSINSEAKPEAIGRGKKVLESTLARRDIDATVEYGNLNHYFRVKYTIQNNPLVSIVIPFKDKPELLNISINSILEKSTYQNFEIIGISNNSEQKETFNMMKTLEKKDARVAFYEYNVEFNYAEINNYAVNTYAQGKHILLLNNDIEIITPEWIESMLEHSQRDEVGCVGAKLYYPNDTIQHAGIIIGLGGYAGHSHKMYPRDNPGYFNRLNVVQNVSAVTAACLMIKKELYSAINGMDEINFKVAYNDVDFCLRVRERGYLNIFTPYAEMYHHESITRGYETTPEKQVRFKGERNNLGQRHNALIKRGDPYYNPNLTLDIEDFSLCRT